MFLLSPSPSSAVPLCSFCHRQANMGPFPWLRNLNIIDFLLNNTLWRATDLWVKNTKPDLVTIGQVLGQCFSTECTSIDGSDALVPCTREGSFGRSRTMESPCSSQAFVSCQSCGLICNLGITWCSLSLHVSCTLLCCSQTQIHCSCARDLRADVL